MSTLVARHARGVKIPVCTVLLRDCFSQWHEISNMKFAIRVVVPKCIFLLLRAQIYSSCRFSVQFFL